jgi:hypothetical protein
MVMRIFAVGALATVFLSIGNCSALAQQASSSQGKGDPKDAVIIALVGDQGFGDATAIISRYKSGATRNVVAIRRSTATSLVLEAAMAQLSDSRRHQGHVPKQGSRAFVMIRGGVSADPATKQLFESLTRASAYSVWSLGTVPAIAVQMKDNTPEKGIDDPARP